MFGGGEMILEFRDQERLADEEGISRFSDRRLQYE